MNCAEEKTDVMYNIFSLHITSVFFALLCSVFCAKTWPSMSIFRCVSTCFSSGPPTTIPLAPLTSPISLFPALCLCPGVRTSCIFPPCFLSIHYHVFSNNSSHNFLSTFVVAAVLKQVLGHYLACKCVLLDGISNPMCACLCVRQRGRDETLKRRGKSSICAA